MSAKYNSVGVSDGGNVEMGLPAVSTENLMDNFEEVKLVGLVGGSEKPLTPRQGQYTIPESRPYSMASSHRTTYLSLDPFRRYKVDDLTNYAMNDQRWTLQRKKIGLKRKTSANKDRKFRNKQTKDISLNFIIQNFSRKECMRYEKDNMRSKLIGEVVCKCGNPIAKHESYKPQQPPFVFNHDKMFNQPYSPSSNCDKKSFFRNVLENQLLNGGHVSFEPLHRIREDSLDSTPYIKRPALNEAGESSSKASEEEKRPEENEEDEEEEDTTDNHILKILEADGINKSIRRNYRQRSEDYSIKDPMAPVSPTAPVLQPDTATPWTPENAMKEFHTNAYGMIEFTNENTGSTKPAKYVRLSDSSNLDNVLALLTDYWRLLEPTRPNLVISVIGGAKNFRLDGKKKETFNKGLIRAVKSTNAWILTGGMQVGVTKCVGEAVNEGQYIVKVKRKTLFCEEQEHLVGGIKCLGLAPWGYTKDNHLLVNRDRTDFTQVKYRVEDSVEKFQNVSLNGDHTHFLLVDDGIRNKYSGADKFRTELQKLIQEPEPVGLGVPVVLIILDGGISSLFEIDMALKNNIPVVVISNTGRAADLLAYGVSMTIQTTSGANVLRQTHKKQLIARVVAAMPELNPHQYMLCANVIVECCKNVRLITIFDINSREGLDKYILYAVLKGGSKNKDTAKVDQLNLALLWNRPDIAECDIFPSCAVWPTESLEDLMTTALLDEKVEFVRLFLINGLIMTEYLTVMKLRMLYNETFSPETHFGRILSMCTKGKHIHLVHVHDLLEVLVKKHCDLVYLADKEEAFHEDPSINYLTFEDPYLELMLWAILNKRPTLARFLWERTNSPMVAAVAATCVYTSLWNSLGAKNTEMRDEYTNNKDMFEELAANFLSQCYKNDSSSAMGIIERRNPKWGDLDCMQLAVGAEDLLFISSPCCQASIDISWRRGMMRAPIFGVILANIMPFLIFTRLFRFQKLGDDGGELTLFQKIIVFYKSPISKFYSHSSIYVGFLLLYAYVVLFDFRPEMTVTEQFVVSLIFTTFLEEIHQLLTEDPARMGAKFTDWWGNVWNRFDVLSFVLSSIALFLRLRPSTFSSGRILYAVNTNFFYIRLFRIYHVSYKLGPKLVIFYRMISEVVVFLSILLIVILGYGIASQGLLHPWRTYGGSNLTTIVGQVLLTPYWQMYGELLLDEINGEDNEQCPISSEWGTPVCENPRNYAWVVNSMLVFYLIIGNIMLLNLLIAIFTYVFDEVQENSMEIWKFEMYKLIREFDNKPGLVPPFVVFEHFYKILKLFWKKYLRRTRENLDEYMKETLKSLEIFEKEEMLSFLSTKKDKEKDSMRSICNSMSEKIDRISKYVEQQEELQEIEEDLEFPVTEEPDQDAPDGTLEVCKVRNKEKRNRKKRGKKANEDSDTTDEDEILNKYLSGGLTLEDMDIIEHQREAARDTHNIFVEGFSSLPFNVGSQPSTRPGSPIYSRPGTGRSTRLATAKLKKRTQRIKIETIMDRLDNLQSYVENSMETICNKLESLTPATTVSIPVPKLGGKKVLPSALKKTGPLIKNVNEVKNTRVSVSTANPRPGAKTQSLQPKSNARRDDSGDGLSDFDEIMND